MSAKIKTIVLVLEIITAKTIMASVFKFYFTMDGEPKRRKNLRFQEYLIRAWAGLSELEPSTFAVSTAAHVVRDHPKS